MCCIGCPAARLVCLGVLAAYPTMEVQTVRMFVGLLAGLLRNHGVGCCAASFMRLHCCMSAGLHHNQLRCPFSYMSPRRPGWGRGTKAGKTG